MRGMCIILGVSGDPHMYNYVVERRGWPNTENQPGRMQIQRESSHLRTTNYRCEMLCRWGRPRVPTVQRRLPSFQCPWPLAKSHQPGPHLDGSFRKDRPSTSKVIGILQGVLHTRGDSSHVRGCGATVTGIGWVSCQLAVGEYHHISGARVGWSRARLFRRILGFKRTRVSLLISAVGCRPVRFTLPLLGSRVFIPPMLLVDGL